MHLHNYYDLKGKDIDVHFSFYFIHEIHWLITFIILIVGNYLLENLRKKCFSRNYDEKKNSEEQEWTNETITL